MRLMEYLLVLLLIINAKQYQCVMYVYNILKGFQRYKNTIYLIAHEVQ